MKMAVWNDKRPMSPHLQIWKWHPAMAASILHRASAIISYAALIFVGLMLLVIVLVRGIPLSGLLFGPLGAIGLFIFMWAFIFMAFAQLRHLIWDQGKMLEPELNNSLSIGMIAGSVVLAAILTFVATGGL